MARFLKTHSKLSLNSYIGLHLLLNPTCSCLIFLNKVIYNILNTTTFIRYFPKDGHIFLLMSDFKGVLLTVGLALAKICSCMSLFATMILISEYITSPEQSQICLYIGVNLVCQFSIKCGQYLTSFTKFINY